MQFPTPDPNSPIPTFLNLGSGFDYKSNYYNVDADPATSPDLILNFETTRLTPTLPTHYFALVLAQDILEHLLHPHGLALLHDSFSILRPGGSLIVRTIDPDLVINAPITTPEKITLLYGGQDSPQPGPHAIARNIARIAHPEFFAHKFAWTQKMLHVELLKIGFDELSFTTIFPNYSTVAKKPRNPKG